MQKEWHRNKSKISLEVKSKKLLLYINTSKVYIKKNLNHSLKERSIQREQGTDTGKNRIEVVKPISART